MKIDVVPIVRDQLRTFVDARTGRLLWSDLLVFYGVPAAVAGGAWVMGWRIASAGHVLTAVALMTGLLFNLLILLFDAAVRIRDGAGEFMAHRRKLVRELQANVTYTLLVCLVLTVVLGAGAVSTGSALGSPLSAVVGFLLLHFVLMLLMLLRRVRAAFQHEFTRSGAPID